MAPPPLLSWDDFVMRRRESVGQLGQRVRRRDAEGYVRPLSAP
ncbi:hypothetical protein [Enhygromyxa salina]|nr:hypothetical protein [Enhygromyxa salina]